MGGRWHGVAVAVACAALAVVSAAATDQRQLLPAPAPEEMMGTVRQSNGNAYHHVWPPMRLRWQIVVGSLLGFLGAAFGSVGGVGGGGIFVPMLTLVVGFDPKSSMAMSKCMIMGAAVSTVYYNLNLKHPTLDMPLIDYNLALLMQPMLMLGVSIGVIFNVIFPDWLVTTLLIILSLGAIHIVEAAERLDQINQELDATIQTARGSAAADKESRSNEAASVLKNVYWKELVILMFVWVAFLVLQISKNYTASCSALFWVLNALQIPISVGATMYEAHGLMSGKKVVSSNRIQQPALKLRQLLVYSLFGTIAGIVGGLLGVGGGSIMGPLFLELGIPPQVSSATATFVMMFSSSMTVIEYFLLHRFPVPYAAYFAAIAFISAIIGQHYARKLIDWLGRASLIIFILASMIFLSAISLGGVGISKAVHKMERHQYMGFEDLCN